MSISWWSKLWNWWSQVKYTKHLCWIAGGRDYEFIIIRHKYFMGKLINRRIVFNPPKSITTTNGKELEADLSTSIDICTQGRPIITGRQEITKRGTEMRIGWWSRFWN